MEVYFIKFFPELFVLQFRILCVQWTNAHYFRFKFRKLELYDTVCRLVFVLFGLFFYAFPTVIYRTELVLFIAVPPAILPTNFSQMSSQTQIESIFLEKVGKLIKYICAEKGVTLL